MRNHARSVRDSSLRLGSMISGTPQTDTAALERSPGRNALDGRLTRYYKKAQAAFHSIQESSTAAGRFSSLLAALTGLISCFVKLCRKSFSWRRVERCFRRLRARLRGRGAQIDGKLPARIFVEYCCTDCTGSFTPFSPAAIRRRIHCRELNRIARAAEYSSRELS